MLLPIIGPFCIKTVVTAAVSCTNISRANINNNYVSGLLSYFAAAMKVITKIRSIPFSSKKNVYFVSGTKRISQFSSMLGPNGPILEIVEGEF